MILYSNIKRYAMGMTVWLVDIIRYIVLYFNVSTIFCIGAKLSKGS